MLYSHRPLSLGVGECGGLTGLAINVFLVLGVVFTHPGPGPLCFLEQRALA